MSQAENTNEIKKHRNRTADERRRHAAKDFELAEALANNCPGLKLKRCAGHHYQLIRYHREYTRRWLLNIYPGNQRLYWDMNHVGMHYLKLSSPWTLISVVEAAIRQACRETKR